ncbi:MAG: hypothetical protein J6V25_06855 [Oscillospiraceae bacterium]|nr:hypothetical protein [Oscillospiraceae bacterium]
MFLYIILEAIVGVIAYLALALVSKKAEGVVYGKLDKAGRVTNILLIPVYLFLSFLCMGLGFFCNPAYSGFLGLLGWIVTVFICSVPLCCGLGLGFSVVLRKKGRSKQSFAVQFAGVAWGLVAVLFFFLFYGNLLKYLN